MRVRRACAALLFFAALALAGAPSHAQESEEALPPLDLQELAKERITLMRTQPVSYRVTRYLQAAGEEMAEGNLEEAKQMLLKLNMKRLNERERANVFRLLAYVYYQIGEQEAALAAFEAAIAEEALPLDNDAQIMFNVVQLHAALEQWPQVVTSLDRWRRHVAVPTGLSLYLRAIAYYQQEQVEPAIQAIEQAVAVEPEPEQSWLQLQAALYVLKEDYASVVPVLEQLVTRFPKKAYWVQLSLIYGAREDYRRSLAVQQLAYLQGYLDTDDEMQRLARSYVFSGLPFEAAHILSEGLQSGVIEKDSKAYEFLANSWIQAREYERSLEPLQEAAQLAEDGKLYIRLGQVHMAREEWAEAADLFTRALDKGDLENPGSAYLLRGISLYNDNRVGPARSSFDQARRHEKSRKSADQWLEHIRREQQSGSDVAEADEEMKIGSR